jgi:hypothetical protein
MGPVNLVLFIEDLKYKDELLKYYAIVEKEKRYPMFDFPLRTISPKAPAYVVGYTTDSALAEIVSLDYLTKNVQVNHICGYVVPSTMHESAPPVSLMPLKYKNGNDNKYINIYLNK